MTRIARLTGLIADRWTMDDCDLSTNLGFRLAEKWLRETRPKRLWLSPESPTWYYSELADQRRKRGPFGDTAFNWLSANWSLVDTSILNNHRTTQHGTIPTRSPATCWMDFRHIASEINILTI